MYLEQASAGKICCAPFSIGMDFLVDAVLASACQCLPVLASACQCLPVLAHVKYTQNIAPVVFVILN